MSVVGEEVMSSKSPMREPDLHVIQSFNKQRELVWDLEVKVARRKDEFMSSEADAKGQRLLLEFLKANAELKAAMSELDRLEGQVIPFLPGAEYWTESLPPEGANQSAVEENLRKLEIDMANVDVTNLDKMIGVVSSVAKTVEMLDRLKKEEYLKPLKDDTQRTLKEAMSITGERVHCNCEPYGFRLVAVEMTDESLENFGKRFWGCPLWISKDEPGCNFCEWIDEPNEG